jgi:hypothetical protein
LCGCENNVGSQLASTRDETRALYKKGKLASPWSQLVRFLFWGVNARATHTVTEAQAWTEMRHEKSTWLKD